MAKKEDRKKQKKRLKERKKEAKRSQLESARASHSLYPSIILQPDGGDPAFVSTVKEIVAAFDFDDPSCCNDSERDVFRLFRREGFSQVHRRAEALAKQAPQAGFDAEQAKYFLLNPLTLLLGQWIFSRLPDAYRTAPLPFYYFRVFPHDRDFYVLFRFLPSTPSDHGTVYYPQAAPKVLFGGGHWKVAFFRHAIERICERICPKPQIGYHDFSLCEIYFRNCVYYEPLALPDGQHGIRLFHKEVPAWQGDKDPYLYGVLGLDRHPGKSTRLYHILGYCPVAFVGPRAVAKTFLSPGFRNTPEDALVRAADIPAEQRRRLLALGSGNVAQQVYSEQGIEAIKWYHHNGVPQVVELAPQVFLTS